MLPVIAIAIVWQTVFSCAVKGCLDHPRFVSHAENGRKMTKEMRPIGMLKVGTIPPGPSEKRIVINENTAPRNIPTIADRTVICVFQSARAAITSSSVRTWSCDHKLCKLFATRFERKLR